MAGDILSAPLPVRDGPNWGRIDGSGLGIEVDEAKLAEAHYPYPRDGHFVPCRL